MRVPKSYKAVSFIVFLIFGSYFLHSKFQFPVAPIDILLSFLSIVAIISMSEFLYEQIKSKPSITKHFYRFKVMAYMILAVFFILTLSYWLIESAIQDPLGHSSASHRCLSHGISNFMMGITAFLIACVLMFELIFVGDRKKKQAEKSIHHAE